MFCRIPEAFHRLCAAENFPARAFRPDLWCVMCYLILRLYFVILEMLGKARASCENELSNKFLDFFCASKKSISLQRFCTSWATSINSFLSIPSLSWRIRQSLLFLRSLVPLNFAISNEAKRKPTIRLLLPEKLKFNFYRTGCRHQHFLLYSLCFFCHAFCLSHSLGFSSVVRIHWIISVSFSLGLFSVKPPQIYLYSSRLFKLLAFFSETKLLRNNRTDNYNPRGYYSRTWLLNNNARSLRPSRIREYVRGIEIVHYKLIVEFFL